MSVKLTGSTFPDPAKQQPYRYGRREGGRFTMVPYESVSQSQITILAQQADALGLNYEVSLTHGKARIEIEYPYNNVAGGFAGSTTESEETWEIVPGKAAKDLLDSRNPLVLSTLGETNGPQEINSLKKWKQQNSLFTNLTDGNGNFITPKIDGTSTAFGAYGIVLAKYIYDGVEQVEIATPVLTHTKVVTANYVYPAQFSNIGKIISSATLISSEGVPGTVLFDFPTDSDPSPLAIGSTGQSQHLLFGWLKNSPSVRQTSKRKWCITQSWDYGLWAMELYGGTRL